MDLFITAAILTEIDNTPVHKLQYESKTSLTTLAVYGV